ncbi:uncharacterized protein FIBRA_02048 [Fibroporia radiculosa]|uniref:protein S-acyltransferase n=1 Tax=Fibroporia radiculosa TaxID=599839 RepID=J4HUA5_9APHY|nr:uncharacterized protein FIBRA_02048 [Fibroporia radiculosa]CCM00022.1 predicted protein [Fibroporia radiculosa]
MATSHSLSSPSRPVTQLPFSPTPRNATRTPGTPTRAHSGSVSSTSPSRSGSLASRPPPNMSHIGESVLPQSMSLPPFQPTTTYTLTHATGVLPSASFFHPTRPSYPPPPPSLSHTRRSSVASIVTSDAPASDPLRLTTLSENHSHGSDGSDSFGNSTDDAKEEPSLDHSVKSPTVKPSREPLLPIGPGSRQARRPSVVIQTATPYGTHDGGVSPTARLRGSFEKLFKRSPVATSPTRAISIKTQPHSSLGETAPRSLAGVPRMTFEMSEEPQRKCSPSPHPSPSSSTTSLTFIATPPPGNKPPRAFMPVVDARTGKPMHNWQLYPSRNRFFFGGRILIGGDEPWAFVASLVVVLGITGVWFGTTCVWWWKHESPVVAAVGAYMCLLTISSMFATAFRDPGILPKDLDRHPPRESGGDQAPLPRDLRVRAGTVRTKFCATCRVYRPPRSSHCKMCDNCVDVTTLILVICTSAIHLYLLTRPPFRLDFQHALQTSQGSGSAAAFVMSILVIWPVMALLLYHARLLLLNVTTIEQIRNQAHKSLVAGPPPPNPFSHGSWRRNLVYVLCRPGGFSWMDATAIATEDRRDVNPGLLRDAEDGWMEEGRVGRKAE